MRTTLKTDIEALVDALYKEWLNTHDPFEDDFMDVLYTILPHLQFTQDGICFYLIGER